MAPCAWSISPTDTCCTGWSTLDPTVQTRAITLATYVMWAATGRRYGICNVTIRPCGNDRRCGECGFWVYDGAWMRPYIWDGVWRNCGCAGACDCKPACQVTLPAPVDTVTSVVIDGVTLDPSKWRVDNNQYLVRTDGTCWPQCQDYDADVPAANTFQVTYGRGEAVPDAVLAAATTLACEFAKACSGQQCRLPGRMQTLSRQGVSVSFADIDMILKRGMTGIPEVDIVIAADNPYHHKQRPFFYSYETAPRFRRVTQA